MDWAELADRLNKGESTKARQEPEPLAPYSLMDGLRQVARGGIKGVGGMASLLPELALSAVKYAPYGVPGMMQSAPQISSQIPYDMGDFSSMVQKDIDPILPASKPQDLPFVETASEIAIPGFGLLGLGKKAAATAVSQGKNIPLIAKLFGGTTSPVVETAGILGASTAAGGAAQLDAPAEYQALAALLGGVGATTTAGLTRAGGKAAMKYGSKAINKAPETLEKGKRVLNKFGQELPEKAQEASEAMAVRKLLRAVDADDTGASALVSRIDDLPENTLGTLGERLNDPKLLGLEEHLSGTMPVAAERRLATDRGVLNKIKGTFDELAPPTTGTESIDVQRGLTSAERTARTRGGAMFEAVDPEGVSSIPINKVKYNLWDKGSQIHLDSLRSLKGEDAKLVRAFVKEPKSLPINKLQKYSSLAGKRAEEAMRAGRKGDANILREMKSSIADAIDRAADAGRLAPEDASMWKAARKNWADYEQTYNKGVTKQIRKSESPSLLGKQLLKQPDEDIQRLVKALPKEQIPSARRLVVDEILEGSRKPGTEILEPKKLAERIRVATKKTSALFEKEHVKAMDEIGDIVSRKVDSKETAKVFSKAFEQGKIKSMFEHAKDMMSSRLGWKYPIRRKIIQVATHKGKQQNASIEDLMNQALVEMLHDPEYAKALITKHTADGAKSFVNKSTGKILLDGALTKTKELLSGAVSVGSDGAASYASAVVRRGLPAAGLLAIGEEDPLTDLAEVVERGTPVSGVDSWEGLAERLRQRSEADDFFLSEEQPVEAEGFERTSFIPEEMPEMTLTSDSGIDFIKQHEGLRLTAYDDGTGKRTIGYGHTADVPEKITKEEAEAKLIADIEKHEDAVKDLVKVTLNQEQFDALSSFTFNLGAGALKRSTLLKKLNAGDYQGAADEFLKWDKARIKGKLNPMRGLTKRRQAERELFLKGLEKDLITI